MYKFLIRPLLFTLDAERSHTLATLFLQALNPLTPLIPKIEHDKTLSQTIWKTSFTSPIGVAAGVDKNGVAIPALHASGFGHIEIGTITPKPQQGNPKPRSFRYKKEKAILNRMGFNNKGADWVANHLQTSYKCPIGINIGKQRTTSLNDAYKDYKYCHDILYPFADYFVINISSPNTPQLRALQSRPFLQQLTKLKKHKPILIKLAPDFTDKQFDAIIKTIQSLSFDGIVLTNTTTDYDILPQSSGPGGISGKPLYPKVIRLITRAHTLTKGTIPIIGVGGIFNADDAYTMIKAGASLVQVYTGLVYEGPSIGRQISYGLAALLKKDGYKSLSKAIGVEARRNI